MYIYKFQMFFYDILICDKIYAFKLTHCLCCYFCPDLYRPTELFAYWVILQAFMSPADFFQNQLFRKFISEIPNECHKDWIQIRPDILSGLIWVQTVCKSYQQTALEGKELKHHLKFAAEDIFKFYVDSFRNYIKLDIPCGLSASRQFTCNAKPYFPQMTIGKWTFSYLLHQYVWNNPSE